MVINNTRQLERWILDNTSLKVHGEKSDKVGNVIVITVSNEYKILLNHNQPAIMNICSSQTVNQQFKFKANYPLNEACIKTGKDYIEFTFLDESQCRITYK